MVRQPMLRCSLAQQAWGPSSLHKDLRRLRSFLRSASRGASQSRCTGSFSVERAGPHQSFSGDQADASWAETAGEHPIPVPSDQSNGGSPVARPQRTLAFPCLPSPAEQTCPTPTSNGCRHKAMQRLRTNHDQFLFPREQHRPQGKPEAANAPKHMRRSMTSRDRNMSICCTRHVAKH